MYFSDKSKNKKEQNSTAECGLKSICSNHFSFSTFKFKSFRYCLLCDVMLLIAFNDAGVAEKILNFFLDFSGKRYHSNILKLKRVLFENEQYGNEFKSAHHLIDRFHKNTAFTLKPLKSILITATASAGKSTLINALIGSEVFDTGNGVCTRSVQKAYNKPFDDNLVYKAENSVVVYSDAFSDMRVCFIDTPGVNTAKFEVHDDITRSVVTDSEYDVIVYVFNAEQLSNDDVPHLCSVLKNKRQSAQIIFALNKMDSLNAVDGESAQNVITHLREFLSKMSVENPIICPVSAKTGSFAMKAQQGKPLTKHESRMLDGLAEHFGDELFNLSEFYDEKGVATGATLIGRCGISGLAKIIRYCLEENKNV